MTDRLRIGNAQAFWGDRAGAAAEMLASEPDLDYLTLDYLAEVSMSILAVQRSRDPQRGYAVDFLDVVRSLAPYWALGGSCRLITNAGGLHPHACARAVADVLEQSGCRAMRVAAIDGDDVMDVLRQLPADDHLASRHLETGQPIARIADRLVTANAYLGAMPLVEALNAGAEIVITGRVADPSLTVAACWHHFGWREDDWDRLAGATVAGHLIECGTQVTGGNLTDWLDVPDAAHIGYPIAEVSASGDCIITKPRGTGGCVNRLTVTEQLLYEIADPGRYISPDVTVSFESIQLQNLGDDQVLVQGAIGSPRPDTLKVSATYRDGYRAAGTLTIAGRNSRAKAQRCGQIVLQRMHDAGCQLQDAVIECLGHGDANAGLLPDTQSESFSETVLRIAVQADSREAVERFSKELMSLITAGPAGTTGYAEGRPRVHQVFRYWPCLIPRQEITPRIHVLTTSGPSGDVDSRSHRPCTPSPPLPCSPSPPLATGIHNRTLYDLAYARSGDKGTSANIGVVARSVDDYPFLRQWLTAQRVQAFFLSREVELVERFELPNLNALNFVLHGVLKQSLRTDAQGKTLAQALLQMPLPQDHQGDDAS